MRKNVPLLSLMLMLLPLACREQSTDPPRVAASNSLLECAARDLLGESTRVLRLAQPGTCPGHFDIRPSQVSRLRRCRVLLRLDFQRSLDAKLSGATADGLTIAEVRITGGLCEPTSYLAACRQTADALVKANLLQRAKADQRLSEIQARIAHLAETSRRRVDGLKDTPVVVSTHQEAFCRWLGLRPVATFSGADSAGVRQLNEAVRKADLADVRLIIANRPEGRRVADALADRLGARVVVFDNFPALNSGQSSFDDLLTTNVDALVKAAAAR